MVLGPASGYSAHCRGCRRPFEVSMRCARMRDASLRACGARREQWLRWCLRTTFRDRRCGTDLLPSFRRRRWNTCLANLGPELRLAFVMEAPDGGCHAAVCCKSASNTGQKSGCSSRRGLLLSWKAIALTAGCASRGRWAEYRRVSGRLEGTHCSRGRVDSMQLVNTS